jgi:hypothetical protein
MKSVENWKAKWILEIHLDTGGFQKIFYDCTSSFQSQPIRIELQNTRSFLEIGIISKRFIVAVIEQIFIISELKN